MYPYKIFLMQCTITLPVWADIQKTFDRGLQFDHLYLE